jgi:ATP-dependent DNA helicase PIF1
MKNELQEKFEETEDYKTFNKGQREFFELFFTGKSIFLSGGGGVGKSYCLQKLIDFCENEMIPVSRTASTGGAALNIRGQTIHSFAGIGIADKNIDAIVKDVLKSKSFNRIKSCKVLILDEVSMLSKRLFTIIDIVLRKVKNSDKPFGGVQLVLTGDFLQLPPVGQGDDGCFAFESVSWKMANITTHVLTESVRQKEASFADALIKLRMSDFSRLSVFKERLNKDILGKFKPLKVFPHKASVDAINNKELAAIKGKEYTFTAERFGKDNHLAFFDKNCQAKKELVLKIGAQVCLVSNISVENGLVNGSFGKIIDVDVGKCGKLCPVVEFKNGMMELIEPVKFEINEEIANGEYKVAARHTQIPLKIAYAGTAHSCQGITCDAIEADLNKIFGYGMGYVVMSRCKTLEGMKIICPPATFGPNKFKQSPKALDFYNGVP